MPSLFHKKSKSNLRSKVVISEPFNFVHHNRTMSTSSTSSTGSSTTKVRSYDPLSSHPALSLNAGPVAVGERAQHEAQSHQQHASMASRDSDFYNREVRPYAYEQDAQWPLKDWQAAPPALTNATEDDAHHNQPSSDDSLSSSPNQNRPARDESPADSYVRRGDWKRRGIIFGLDQANTMEQMRQYENPFEWSNTV